MTAESLVLDEGFQLSFEFFPPRTARGLKTLVSVANKLSRYEPAFYSVTYGAGGSTIAKTASTVYALRDHGLNAIPHLSWGTQSKSTIAAQLREYIDRGITEIVVLRGDRPSGTGPVSPVHHAKDLVKLIRAETGGHFQVHVAAYPEPHPESKKPSTDIEFLREKVEAGADNCITQYFYSTDAYIHFVKDCELAGMVKPIVPGVMPITNYERLVRFSTFCGAELPRWLKERLHEYRDNESLLVEFGIEAVAQLCTNLISANAPGLHFYTLNREQPTGAILDRLLRQPRPT